MNRRRFNLSLAAACGAVCMPGLAWAQGAPVEGKDYVRLAQPVPMPASGKVEVVEFFGYWCPHCNTFEPAIDAWSRKLPADVSFRRVPVAFSAPQEPYAKIYLALEALGQLEALHRKVFTAIHVQRQRLEKDAEITAFVTANGLDATKFMDTYKGFTVASKFKQARQLADAYKIDGVPTIGIHGRFFTSPSLVGSGEQALRVTDYLIQRAKQS
ncbi:MAG TPA: thiol:disulfide interchange protein DsbA/DsbL [Burkholderiaceae bacterium]|jgi:thiol:disulfide interchange protein DsbA|nr:thiol:disulfide interchange protein DsbA/DsbL [Burkholderiaceae bacterium]